MLGTPTNTTDVPCKLMSKSLPVSVTYLDPRCIAVGRVETQVGIVGQASPDAPLSVVSATVGAVSVVSTRTFCADDAELVFPAASVALAVKRWVPSAKVDDINV